MQCGNNLLKPTYFPYLTKCINCQMVYKRMMMKKSAVGWPPPKYPPYHLIKNFTQNGEMPIIGYYYDAQKYSGSNAYVAEWNNMLIKELVNKYNNHIPCGTYNNVEQQELIRTVLNDYDLNNKTIVVIGSELPWLEAILTTKDPKSITTIEYGKIKSKVDLMHTYTPFDFAKDALKKNTEYDAAISFSSIEHSGLGRYGDELEPNGDIHAVEEIYCMLKKNGLFFLSIPYANKSGILWNVHRYYGPERLKHLMANFEQIEYYGKKWNGEYGMIVFRKT